MTSFVSSDFDDGTILFKDLPGIILKNECIIYSPYSMKIASFHKDKINSKDVDRLRKEGFFGSPSNPSANPRTINATLILTTKCDLSCEYCYVLPYNDPLDMTPELSIDAVDYLLRDGYEKIIITFFGGEPTVNMQTLKTTVKRVKESEVAHRFLIISNGTFDGAELDFMLDNDFIFCLSDDGYPDDYTGSGLDRKLLSKVRNNITKIASSKSLIQVRATVTKKNLFHLPDAISLWRTLGVEYAHIEPFGPCGKGDLHLRPKVDEYINTFIKILDEAEKNHLFIISSPFSNLLSPSNYFCTSMVGENIIFTPDGHISGCYRVQTKKSPYSNIFLYADYNEDVKKYIPVRNKRDRLIKIATSLNLKCRSCFAKNICVSGCPLRNKLETGSFQKIADWSCLVKKELIKEAISRIYKASLKDKVPVVFGQALFDEKVINTLKKGDKLWLS